MEGRFLMLATACAGMALTAACSPTLNWRVVPVPDAPLTAHFPCKPDHFSRRLPMAGEILGVGLSSCTAGAQTFAVMAVDMRQAGRAGAGQAALRQAIALNFAGNVQALPAPRQRPGSAPMVGAEHVAARMQRPDGTRLQARMLLFSQGAWVFQATVMGEQAAQPEALDFFFDNLTLSR